MVTADRPFVTVEDVERLLEAQRAALASRDPADLERANQALVQALDAMRRMPPAGHSPEAARRARATLRTQAELLARGQAAVERALGVLVPDTGSGYAARGAPRARPGSRHAVA